MIKLGQKWKVLIVEDNPSYYEPLRAELVNSGRFHVVGIAHTATDAFKYLDDEVPDAVVVDLQLIDGDGFDVLERINDPKRKVDVVPYVLVVTAFASERNQKVIGQMADFIYIKNKGYTPQQAVKHLWRMSTGFGDKVRSELEEARNEIFHAQVEASANRDRLLRQSVDRYLNKFNVGAKLRGYDFLVEAIVRTVEWPVGEKLVMSRLFADIADEFNLEAHTIDTAIRRVLEKAFTEGHVKNSEGAYPIDFPGLLKGDAKVPTNKLFITTLARVIKKNG